MVSIAVPLGSFEILLILTNGFEVDFLDGPAQVDARARLKDVGADLTLTRLPNASRSMDAQPHTQLAWANSSQCCIRTGSSGE